jgi:hypothetical protein
MFEKIFKMNKIILTFFLIICSFNVKSQCNNGNNFYPSDIYYFSESPQGEYQSITNDSYAGEIIKLFVTENDVFSAYPLFSEFYDAELTLTTENGDLIQYEYQTNGGTIPFISWTSDFNGIVYLHLNEYQCQSNQIDTEIMLWWTEGTENLNHNCIDGDCIYSEGGQFFSLAECEKECSSLWACGDGICYETNSDFGTYSSLEECEQDCEATYYYECTQEGCISVSDLDGPGFESLQECLDNCELPMVYYCNEQTGCYEDVIGLSDNYYNSINDCEIQCFTTPETYNCIGNACINPQDGSGTYYSLNDCVTSCDVQQSFDCINGDCIDPLDGTGEFSIFGQCYTSCLATDIENFDDNNFIVFPNPSKDKFNISFLLNKNDKIQITIINSLGQAIYNSQKSYIAGNVKEKIELKDISKGIYFLILESNEFNQKTKIIIN